MEIKKTLLKDHSKEITDSIVKYIGRNNSRFAELVKVYLAGPYRVSQRAAWPLSYCIMAHPQLIDGHLSKILKFVKKPGNHESVKRNTVRLLQFIEIPKRFHGQVVDLCFGYLTDPKEAIATKVFSMTVLASLVGGIPELKKELKIVIEDQMPYGSAGFISRGKKVLKELSKP
jgi:hypothetical protein